MNSKGIKISVFLLTLLLIVNWFADVTAIKCIDLGAGNYARYLSKRASNKEFSEPSYPGYSAWNLKQLRGYRKDENIMGISDGCDYCEHRKSVITLSNGKRNFWESFTCGKDESVVHVDVDTCKPRKYYELHYLPEDGLDDLIICRTDYCNVACDERDY